MKFSIINHDYKYELEKVARLFLPFEKFIFCNDVSGEGVFTEKVTTENGAILRVSVLIAEKSTCRTEILPTELIRDFNNECERLLSVMLHDCLCELTGYSPQWGILTGVRPARLLSRLSTLHGEKGAIQHLKHNLLVSSDKIELCRLCLESEREIISKSSFNSFSLYISIPFCPSRCSYCSFVSHSIERASALIPSYVETLCNEIEQTAKIASLLNLRLETIYIGGGTPTILSAEQLTRILSTIKFSFNMNSVREFTVEAGRPDTITESKLLAIKSLGATRISINPQTMSDEVLEKIGRRHSVQDTIEAFQLARRLGFNNINMDLIAGLEGDTYNNFSDTVEKVIKLKPESVTVHSLAMKRSSALTENGRIFGDDSGTVAALMLQKAYSRLTAEGLLPYYMYRQGKTVGNLENVGYAKKGFECLYNVYIMDETHTILACGASAVSKLREPNGEHIERIFNYKYPYEYLNMYDEILRRKNKVSEFYEIYGKVDQ